MQIDGQPVDTSAWDQANPYQAVLKKKVDDQWQKVAWDKHREEPIDPELRIFARSASDSKGSGLAFLTTIDIMARRGIKPDFNIKVIMDFQEELGSPTLPQLVEEKRAFFESEIILIMDGTRHLSNLPTLTFGARGIATISLKVFGANRDLHSGQYGNFAPNPVFKLSRLIADMKDEHGRVLIPGSYDGITLTEADKRILENVPEDLDEIKKTSELLLLKKLAVLTRNPFNTLR